MRRHRSKAKHLKNNGPADDWKYADWERHAVAIHEASHAVAMYRLQKREMIDVATIERRGGTGGFVAPVPLEEQFVDWKSGKELDVITFARVAGRRAALLRGRQLGGRRRRPSERDHDRRGHGGVRRHGSDGRLAWLHAGRGRCDGQRHHRRGPQLPRDRARPSGREAVQELLQRAHGMLVEDRRYVLAIAHALETHKTITGEDIVAIFEGARAPRSTATSTTPTTS